MIRTQSFEKALPVVAGFITDKIGIAVLRGLRACTDSQAIYLPKLPELGLSVRDVVRAIAYIYHESFHILWTNFRLSKSSLTPLERGIVEVLEDIRIEHKGIARFPAARRYLGQLCEMFTEDGLAGKSPSFPPLSVEDTEARLLQFYMLYRLRHDVLKQVAIVPVCEPTMRAAAAKFPRGMMVRLDALMFEVVNCDSTDDIFSLGAEIAKMIKEEKEKEEERLQQQQQQQQSGNQPQPGGAGDETEAGGASASGSGDAGAKAEGEGQSCERAGAANRGQDEEQGSAVASGGSGAGGTHSGDLGRLLSMEEGEIADTVDVMLEEALNSTAGQQRQGVSMPNVNKLNLRNGSVNMASIAASINAIRTKTLQWMSSVAESDVQHARSGVMIDFTRLHAARHGGEIFIRSDDGIDLNAAVSFVIDRSGSMRSTIQQAATATLAAMLAFDVPGIETQVAVFPVLASVQGVDEEGVGVVKRWEESPRHLAGRIASLNADGGTPMAEAILFAASDILRRQETLRIVMVVTDGDPNELALTKEVIETVRAAGVTVVGLGIGVDPSEVFGEPCSATLHDVAELSGAMVKLIKSSMAH